MTTHSIRSIALFVCLLTTLAESGVHAQRQPVRITSITPAAGRAGDSVTITGQGFAAINARVTVNGVAASVLQATGNRIVFVVPPGVTPGSVVVTVTHPAGFSASIGFAVTEGVLLRGGSTIPASQALIDMPPVPVNYVDIENGLILTRLAARLAPDATVGQVNAAMLAVGGGIVSMHPATLSVTVATPRQSSLADVESLARSLAAQPGISAAWPAFEVQPRLVRFNVTQSELAVARFLLPARFPAAWNALTLAVTENSGSLTCRRPKVPLLIADVFGSEPAGFANSFPTLRRAGPAPLGLSAAAGEHGYTVALAAAGPFGANPFAECLDVRLIQAAGFHPSQDVLAIERNMPAGKFIVNYSMGFRDTCAADPCVPPTDHVMSAQSRAYDALEWKELTQARWDDFLMVVAAGNERNDPSAAIWPGAADATVSSSMTVAALADPLFGFAINGSLWTPGAAAAAQGFATLATDATQQAQLVGDVQARNLGDAADVAANVVTVGSTANMTAGNVLTTFVSSGSLAESAFSDRNADVRAVGEEVFDHPDGTGTSFSAPQVAGLASYLWLLSPDLRDSQPPSITKRAIVANARGGNLDAYAAVLSLDAAATPTAANAPVRLAILDLDADGGFTEADIDLFLRALYFVDSATGEITGGPPAVSTATFNAFDLNGDGFATSISRRERFDLDRVGSTQYGATAYGSVTQSIQGQTITFDENALTDVEILCYYAYSPLYTGFPDSRDDMLGGRCGLAVSPTSVTLNAGQQQQFTATAPVSWAAAGGSISPAGLFTAGTTAGTFTVSATSLRNSSLRAEATVTVNATTPPPTNQIAGPYDGEESRSLVGGEPSTGTARWHLRGGSTGGELLRDGIGVCPNGIHPFICSPIFSIAGGAFSATAAGKTVTGTVGGGHLHFTLEEDCVNNQFELVRCQTVFDGTLVTIQVQTTQLDFGTVASGTTSGQLSFSLTNLGLASIRISIGVPPPFMVVGNTCNPSVTNTFFADPQASCTVFVTFSPLFPFTYGGTADVLASGAAVSGTVTLRGAGN